MLFQENGKRAGSDVEDSSTVFFSLYGNDLGGPINVSQIRTVVTHKANASTFGRSKPLGASMSELYICQFGRMLDVLYVKIWSVSQEFKVRNDQPSMCRSRHAENSGCHVFDRRRGLLVASFVTTRRHGSYIGLSPSINVKLHMWTRTEPPRGKLQV